MNKIITILLAAGLLTACGGESKQEEPKGVIPEHMVEGMEKADDVDDVLKKADAARWEEVDNQ